MIAAPAHYSETLGEVLERAAALVANILKTARNVPLSPPPPAPLPPPPVEVPMVWRQYRDDVAGLWWFSIYIVQVYPRPKHVYPQLRSRLNVCLNACA